MRHGMRTPLSALAEAPDAIREEQGDHLVLTPEPHSLAGPETGGEGLCARRVAAPSARWAQTPMENTQGIACRGWSCSCLFPPA